MEQKTRRRGRLAAAALAVGLVLTLTACGGDQTSSQEDAMKKAQEAMADVSSMRYAATVNLGMSYMGETIDFATTAQTDLIVDPAQMKMDLTVNAGPMGNLSAVTYVMPEGESYAVYTNANNGTESSGWTKEELPDLSQVKQYDGKETMNLYLDLAKNFEEKGTETVDGKELLRYDGTIQQENIEKALQAAGTMELLKEMGIESDALFTGESEGMTLSLWLDPQTYYPMKYEMDMTSLMKNVLTNVLGGSQDSIPGFSISTCTASMTIQEVNTISSITLPPEALQS